MIDSSKLSSRIVVLDSLRGLACLTVVLCHAAANAFPSHNIFELSPFYILIAGHEAVVFFFILSGFVLVKHCLAVTKFNYKFFLIQRVCRIYLPYLGAIVIALLLYFLFHGRWIVTETEGLTWPNVFGHLFLIGNFNAATLDPIIWSLIHEMRIAIIFPLLLIVLRRPWQQVIFIAISLSLIAAILTVLNVNPSASYNSGYLYTVHYFSLFLLGGLLVEYQSELSEKYRGLSFKLKVVFLGVALFFYCYARMLSLIPHKLKLLNFALFNEFTADWVTAIAVLYIMIAGLNISKKGHVLQSRIPLLLGKISFSLYLLHVLVMIALGNLLPLTPKPVTMGLSVIVSALAAFVFNKIIELPAAKIGKMLSKKKRGELLPVEIPIP